MLAFVSRLLSASLIFIVFYLLVFTGDVQSNIFLHLNSFMLVLLGSLGACMLSFNIQQVFTAFFNTLKSLFIDKTDANKKNEITALIAIAEEIKKTNGLGCIDDLLEKQKYSPFMRYGLEIISSGYDAKKSH